AAIMSSQSLRSAKSSQSRVHQTPVRLRKAKSSGVGGTSRHLTAWSFPAALAREPRALAPCMTISYTTVTHGSAQANSFQVERERSRASRRSSEASRADLEDGGAPVHASPVGDADRCRSPEGCKTEAGQTETETLDRLAPALR